MIEFKKLKKYMVFFISYVITFMLLYLLFTKKFIIAMPISTGIISTLTNYVIDTLPRKSGRRNMKQISKTKNYDIDEYEDVV